MLEFWLLKCKSRRRFCEEYILTFTSKRQETNDLFVIHLFLSILFRCLIKKAERRGLFRIRIGRVIYCFTMTFQERPVDGEPSANPGPQIKQIGRLCYIFSVDVL